MSRLSYGDTRESYIYGYYACKGEINFFDNKSHAGIHPLFRFRCRGERVRGTPIQGVEKEAARKQIRAL